MIDQLAPPPAAAQALAELRELLASDGHAITFQSLSSYRTAMLRAADDYLNALPAHERPLFTRTHAKR